VSDRKDDQTVGVNSVHQGVREPTDQVATQTIAERTATVRELAQVIARSFYSGNEVETEARGMPLVVLSGCEELRLGLRMEG
jgi:hypothetical protein